MLSNTKRLNLSKRMSFSLRHGPQFFDFTMNDQAQVELNDFARAVGIPLETVLWIVENDEKNRFTVRNGLIWCSQGHTFNSGIEFPVVSDADMPAYLYHGTKRDFVNSILESGLRAMSRQYVHLSGDTVRAQTVADRRKGESVILRIDTALLRDAGIVVRIAENGVYLTEDIPADCISLLLD